MKETISILQFFRNDVAEVTLLVVRFLADNKVVLNGTSHLRVFFPRCLVILFFIITYSPTTTPIPGHICIRLLLFSGSSFVLAT